MRRYDSNSCGTCGGVGSTKVVIGGLVSSHNSIGTTLIYKSSNNCSTCRCFTWNSSCKSSSSGMRLSCSHDSWLKGVVMVVVE